jgi:hypothetical protein
LLAAPFQEGWIITAHEQFTVAWLTVYLTWNTQINELVLFYKRDVCLIVINPSIRQNLFQENDDS